MIRVILYFCGDKKQANSLKYIMDIFSKHEDFAIMFTGPSRLTSRSCIGMDGKKYGIILYF
jgi:hypothetical protein